MKEYLAITPARDEEKFLPGLIASMTNQTCLPARWIIIDDGSSDASAALIDQAAQNHRWIEPHHLPRNRKRAPGGESVIMQFLRRDLWERFDFILRVDADVSFNSTLVGSLIGEFAREQNLGIVSPVLLEPSPANWREVRNPHFHTRGPMKMYSRLCFAAIGGLEPGLGWDTVDETRAWMLGFKTWSCPHLSAFHHRPQGAASGMRHARIQSGRAAYYSGYSPIFMIARALRHSFRRRPATGALMLAGYFQGYLHRWPRLASPELIRFVRRQQVRRLLRMESIWQ